MVGCAYIYKVNIIQFWCEIFHTYLLDARETARFVIPRPAMFPEAKPGKKSPVGESQNILHSSKQAKNHFYFENFNNTCNFNVGL